VSWCNQKKEAKDVREKLGGLCNIPSYITANGLLEKAIDKITQDYL
jgi:hypothetical protein